MNNWRPVPLVSGYSLPEEVIAKLETYDMYLHDSCHRVNVTKLDWPVLWDLCVNIEGMGEYIENNRLTIVIDGN